MGNVETARAELQKLGVARPSAALVENWLRAAKSANRINGVDLMIHEQSRELDAASPSGGEAEASRSSKSNLEPVLLAQGTLENPAGRRRPGRPRIVASWFEKVAQTMADGTSLGTALAMNGISLSKSEVRACYRNRTLQALYQQARRRYLAEHYGRKSTLRARIGRYL